MRPFFEIMPWLMMVFVPALVMRIFAEEKRVNTLEVLLTLPLSETDIVLSKFISLVMVGFFTLFLTVSIPITLMIIGRPYLPEVLISYFGSLLMMSSFIALSMFFSSLTKNQIVAFLFSSITIFFFVLLGTDFFSSFFPRFLTQSLAYFSFSYHYANFLKGLIDLRSLIYFLSIIAIFIFFTVINLEKRD